MKRLLPLLLFPVLVVLCWPGTAGAHPVGNFSVNQLHKLTFTPTAVQVAAVVDFAELPTVQARSTVDVSGAAGCAELARDFAVTVAGRRLDWTVTRHAFAYQPGTGGLETSRLECGLEAPARFSDAVRVDVANTLYADRVGWHELVAVGSGVLVTSSLPAQSMSRDLTAYPDDLLSSPVDVRTARLTVAPGSGTVTSDGSGGSGAAGSTDAAGIGGWLASAEETLRGWLGAREVTPLLGTLAVLLALALGAGHALLPGHGKTVMAAYLAGRHGRRRDALLVGATVTLTHTGGVLVLGLLLTTTAGLVGESVLGWLGVVSGVLVAAVGVAMLRAVRRTGHGDGAHTHGSHSHTHGHAHGGHSHDGHDHPHESGHSHDHDGHDHPHESGHSHGDGQGHRSDRLAGEGRRGPGRLALVGMGLAGGLVPSPSALVVLLGAIALGRTAFGVLLVLAYGLGMAAVLTAAGLLLIRVRDRLWPRLGRLRGLVPRIGRLAPTGTAALVLLVGLGLAGRALLTI